MNFIKRFLEWIQVKEKLDNLDSKPPLFTEGSFGGVLLGKMLG
jgi:hypothetical protein